MLGIGVELVEDDTIDEFFLSFKAESALIPDPAIPNASINNPEDTFWIRLDQFIVSWLFISISKNMLGHVVRCTSAIEVWFVLEQLFSTQSKACISQLHLLL